MIIRNNYLFLTLYCQIYNGVIQNLTLSGYLTSGNIWTIMALTDFDSIDDIVKNGKGYCLIIKDELSWDEELRHISAIQNKLKSYIYFLQSNQLLKSYPDSEGQQVTIKIEGEHAVPEKYKTLLTEEISNILDNEGFSFEWSVK